MTGSVFGPIFFSWLADWIGVLNVVIVSVVISGVLQFALLGATTSGSVVVIGLFYGFFSSGFQAMLGPIFSRLSFSVTEIGHRMGLGFFVIGVGSLIGQSHSLSGVQQQPRCTCSQSLNRLPDFRRVIGNGAKFCLVEGRPLFCCRFHSLSSCLFWHTANATVAVMLSVWRHARSHWPSVLATYTQNPEDLNDCDAAIETRGNPDHGQREVLGDFNSREQEENCIIQTRS